MKYLFPIVALLLISETALTAEIFHKTKLDMVYPWKDGNFYLGIETEHESCTNANKFYRVWVDVGGVTEKGIDKIYSAALAAAAQGSEVEIIFEPNADGHC